MSKKNNQKPITGNVDGKKKTQSINECIKLDNVYLIVSNKLGENRVELQFDNGEILDAIDNQVRETSGESFFENFSQYGCCCNSVRLNDEQFAEIGKWIVENIPMRFKRQMRMAERFGVDLIED